MVKLIIQTLGHSPYPISFQDSFTLVDAKDTRDRGHLQPAYISAKEGQKMNKRSFILPILLGLNLLAPCPPGNVMAETAKQLYDKAIGLGKEGRCEEAVKLLQKASENEPQTMAVTISLSFATDCSAGNLAKDVAKTIFASTSAGNGGDWSTALSLAKKACDLAPKYAPGFVHLGVVYAQMVLSNKGDNYASDAIKSYSRAIEIDANNGFAHYNIGVAYAAQHKWSMAKEHLSKASSLGIRIPGDVMARVQSEAASGEKKQETKKESIISSLWPFGSEGWICKHMYPSAYTETERNFWNAIGGCTRGK